MHKYNIFSVVLSYKIPRNLYKWFQKEWKWKWNIVHWLCNWYIKWVFDFVPKHLFVYIYCLVPRYRFEFEIELNIIGRLYICTLLANIINLYVPSVPTFSSINYLISSEYSFFICFALLGLLKLIQLFFVCFVYVLFNVCVFMCVWVSVNVLGELRMKTRDKEFVRCWKYHINFCESKSITHSFWLHASQTNDMVFFFFFNSDFDFDFDFK